MINPSENLSPRRGGIGLNLSLTSINDLASVVDSLSGLMGEHGTLLFAALVAALAIQQLGVCFVTWLRRPF